MFVLFRRFIYPKEIVYIKYLTPIKNDEMEEQEEGNFEVVQ
jgi:hypothetical protein